jgi:hypothetical protein
MSGGRIAISGFDYQAIVILDQLFDHFDQHAGDPRARPEGKDDLDLVWTENGRDRRRHVQVKKPRETDQGVPKNQPWRLSEVADELLPNTLDQLATSDSQQAWILGDAVQPQVRRLVAAGCAAAAREADLYWSVVHVLQAENIELWRGFARLREHSRFREVARWRKTLENVLATNMRWFHKQDIARVLEGNPGSYVTVESRLSREENWVHFNRCEIDSLDEAAEKLFQETQ